MTASCVPKRRGPTIVVSVYDLEEMSIAPNEDVLNPGGSGAIISTPGGSSSAASVAAATALGARPVPLIERTGERAVVLPVLYVSKEQRYLVHARLVPDASGAELVHAYGRVIAAVAEREMLSPSVRLPPLYSLTALPWITPVLSPTIGGSTSFSMLSGVAGSTLTSISSPGTTGAAAGSSGAVGANHPTAPNMSVSVAGASAGASLNSPLGVSVPVALGAAATGIANANANLSTTNSSSLSSSSVTSAAGFSGGRVGSGGPSRAHPAPAGGASLGASTGAASSANSFAGGSGFGGNTGVIAHTPAAWLHAVTGGAMLPAAASMSSSFTPSFTGATTSSLAAFNDPSAPQPSRPELAFSNMSYPSSDFLSSASASEATLLSAMTATTGPVSGGALLLCGPEDRVDALRWFIRVSGTAPVTLAHDLSQEDELAALRAGWEKAMAGRAKKGKMLRDKYLEELAQTSISNNYPLVPPLNASTSKLFVPASETSAFPPVKAASAVAGAAASGGQQCAWPAVPKAVAASGGAYTYPPPNSFAVSTTPGSLFPVSSLRHTQQGAGDSLDLLMNQAAKNAPLPLSSTHSRFAPLSMAPYPAWAPPLHGLTPLASAAVAVVKNSAAFDYSEASLASSASDSASPTCPRATSEAYYAALKSMRAKGQVLNHVHSFVSRHRRAYHMELAEKSTENRVDELQRWRFNAASDTVAHTLRRLQVAAKAQAQDDLMEALRQAMNTSYVTIPDDSKDKTATKKKSVAGSGAGVNSSLASTASGLGSGAAGSATASAAGGAAGGAGPDGAIPVQAYLERVRAALDDVLNAIELPPGMRMTDSADVSMSSGEKEPSGDASIELGGAAAFGASASASSSSSSSLPAGRPAVAHSVASTAPSTTGSNRVSNSSTAVATQSVTVSPAGLPAWKVADLVTQASARISTAAEDAIIALLTEAEDAATANASAPGVGAAPGAFAGSGSSGSGSSLGANAPSASFTSGGLLSVPGSVPPVPGSNASAAGRRGPSGSFSNQTSSNASGGGFAMGGGSALGSLSSAGGGGSGASALNSATGRPSRQSSANRERREREKDREREREAAAEKGLIDHHGGAGHAYGQADGSSAPTSVNPSPPSSAGGILGSLGQTLLDAAESGSTPSDGIPSLDLSGIGSTRTSFSSFQGVGNDGEGDGRHPALVGFLQGRDIVPADGKERHVAFTMPVLSPDRLTPVRAEHLRVAVRTARALPPAFQTRVLVLAVARAELLLLEYSCSAIHVRISNTPTHAHTHTHARTHACAFSYAHAHCRLLLFSSVV